MYNQCFLNSQDLKNPLYCIFPGNTSTSGPWSEEVWETVLTNNKSSELRRDKVRKRTDRRGTRQMMIKVVHFSVFLLRRRWKRKTKKGSSINEVNEAGPDAGSAQNCWFWFCSSSFMMRSFSLNQLKVWAPPAADPPSGSLQQKDFT